MSGTRVVITGMGAVSCLGLTLDGVSRSLRAGRSAIVIDPVRVEMGFRSPLTGAIDPSFDVRNLVNRKQAKSMGQPAQYAVGAAMGALEHGRLERDTLRSPRVGVIIGNDSCTQPAVEAADILRDQGETRYIGSGRILQVMNSTVTMNLATLFGIQGASWTVSGACASGAHAIGQAFSLIKSGLQDLVLCGGAQEINWETMCSFDALGAFAKLGDDPASACRPFDADRTGLVPSGGAAVLIIESLDHARARDAEILAEVLAYAFSTDGDHVTQPNGIGARRAISACLEQAKHGISELEYINAHATGTPVGDVVEGEAILELGGGSSPPISSTKSMTGHECWMAGTSEVIYSLLMMRDGFIAPSINVTKIDPALGALDLVTETRDTRPRLILSTSFGFGGTNATLLLEAFEP